MRRAVKVALGVLNCGALFAAAFVIEASVRSCYGGQMTISGLPVTNARVTGAWTPDFFCVGKAWTIKVQSKQGVEIILDGSPYRIPPGSHELYSNHNQTNTGQFGNQDFWGYPEEVKVRSVAKHP